MTYPRAVLLAALLSGCGDDDDSTGEGEGEAGEGEGETGEGEGGEGEGGEGEGEGEGEDVFMPALDELDADAWTELRPGGDTICSRGTEFAFFVHPGTVDRVVIDFVGGGACWDEATCGFADAIFSADVEPVREAVAENDPHGIYDRENPENPVRDWTHVVIPYCTGDIHWGDAVVTYGEGDEAFTIHHAGAINARAVLDWVYRNVAAPEHVLVTGCSAGSYGSILWSADVMEHYAGVPVTQFGDSGAGIVTDSFFALSFPNWNAAAAFPSFIPELDPAEVDVQGKSLPDLYAGIGNYFGEQRVSQYDTAFDSTQTSYFHVMGGGDAADWSEQMFASIEDTEERTPSFGSFIASGEQHCIILFDNFYTVNVGGRRLVDFLQAMIDREPVERLRCTDDCADPTP